MQRHRPGQGSASQGRARPTFRLADVAPRLARARDARATELIKEARERRRHTTRLMELERLVAHRELQFLRAGATGSRKYVAGRARKLAAARRALERELASTQRAA
jgi:hypothetical protein